MCEATELIPFTINEAMMDGGCFDRCCSCGMYHRKIEVDITIGDNKKITEEKK